ncbi:unnamed protein product [Lampetra planeri]
MPAPYPFSRAPQRRGAAQRTAQPLVPDRSRRRTERPREAGSGWARGDAVDRGSDRAPRLPHPPLVHPPPPGARLPCARARATFPHRARARPSHARLAESGQGVRNEARRPAKPRETKPQQRQRRHGDTGGSAARSSSCAASLCQCRSLETSSSLTPGSPGAPVSLSSRAPRGRAVPASPGRGVRARVALSRAVRRGSADNSGDRGGRGSSGQNKSLRPALRQGRAAQVSGGGGPRACVRSHSWGSERVTHAPHHHQHHPPPNLHVAQPRAAAQEPRVLTEPPWERDGLVTSRLGLAIRASSHETLSLGERGGGLRRGAEGGAASPRVAPRAESDRAGRNQRSGAPVIRTPAPPAPAAQRAPPSTTAHWPGAPLMDGVGSPRAHLGEELNRNSQHADKTALIVVECCSTEEASPLSPTKRQGGSSTVSLVQPGKASSNLGNRL